MKKALIIIIIALLGVGLCAYPVLSNYITEKNSSYAADAYAEKISELKEEELKKAWEEAEEYNQNLEGNPVHDPYLEGTGMVMSDNYYEVLNIDESMGYITIPKIDVKLPIFHGTAEETLAKGVGHLEGSSMPIGGNSSHSVLTGHTGLTTAKMFTDLTELKEGDLFFIHVLNQTLAYQVDRIKVTEPNSTQDLARVPGEDYSTLITCTPYGVNSHRLLVRGTRVPYTEELEQQAEDSAAGLTSEQRMLIIAIAVSSAVMTGLIIIAAVWTRRRNKRRYSGNS